MKEFDYKHSPLREGQFRLLNLHPARGSADLESNLVVRSLGTAVDSASPILSRAPNPEPYRALSYTWGPPCQNDLFIKILADSRAFRIAIRLNLETALRQLRSPDREQFFWIDALCINQKNDDEKSSQIPEMWRIYTQAFSVCIWLGIHEDESATAMEFIKDCLDFEIFEQLVHDTQTSKKWAALAALMRRPWFSRRWIVQEIALAREATLHCGDKQVEWQDFADAISLFHSKQHEIRKLFRESTAFHNHPDYLGDVSELGATRLVEASANIFRKSDDNQIMEHLLSLEALMSMLSSAFEASDPHDTVYAILWMAQDARPIFFGDPRNAYSPGPSPMQSPALRPAHFDSSQLDSDLPKASSLSSHNKHVESIDLGKSFKNHEVPVFHVSNEDRQAQVTVVRHSAEQDSVSTNESDEKAKALRTNEVSKEMEISMANQNTHRRKNSPNTSLKIPPSITTRNVAARFTKSIKGKRITVDYKKSVFEVCRDFLAFTINRSFCLDMICMPWAPDAPPDEPSLPSWIPGLSGKAFGLSINKAYRRVNADPLVGNPGWGRRHYNAAPKTYATPILQESSDTTLRVKGFAFDMIRKKNFPATSGIIPSQWLHVGAWKDTSEYPPDQFWRTLVGNRDNHGQRPPAHWMRACKDAFSRRPTGGALDTKELLMYDCPAATTNFVERVQRMVWERRLVLLTPPPYSSSGGGPKQPLGLAPVKCKKGDLVCILFGCSVPVLLRKYVDGKAVRNLHECDCKHINCRCEQIKSKSVPSKSGESGQVVPRIHYELVGECYVHGMMDGEAFRVLKEKGLEYEMFDLE